nr:PREDICTED: uncharacterized protein LOC107398614 [Tribolium castaneum]|eukprot:XP_015838753.1 PREDICTED: uncharacterized protein LOC107398614 [Tribolium castaneum]
MADGTGPPVLGPLDFPNLESENCNFCSRPVRNRVLCVKCKKSFHPSCLNQANQAKNPKCLHERNADTVNTPETMFSNDIIIEFLKSREFGAIIQKAVRVETEKLHKKIESLEKEVRFLKRNETRTNVTEPIAREEDENILVPEKEQLARNTTKNNTTEKVKFDWSKEVEENDTDANMENNEKWTTIVKKRNLRKLEPQN